MVPWERHVCIVVSLIWTNWVNIPLGCTMTRQRRRHLENKRASSQPQFRQRNNHIVLEHKLNDYFTGLFRKEKAGCLHYFTFIRLQ